MRHGKGKPGLPKKVTNITQHWLDQLELHDFETKGKFEIQFLADYASPIRQVEKVFFFLDHTCSGDSSASSSRTKSKSSYRVSLTPQQGS